MMGPPSPLPAAEPCLHLAVALPPGRGAVTPETDGSGQGLPSGLPSMKNWATAQLLLVHMGLVVSITVTNAPLGPSPLVTMMRLWSGSKDGSSARMSAPGWLFG